MIEKILINDDNFDGHCHDWNLAIIVFADFVISEKVYLKRAPFAQFPRPEIPFVRIKGVFHDPSFQKFCGLIYSLLRDVPALFRSTRDQPSRQGCRQVSVVLRATYINNDLGSIH